MTIHLQRIIRRTLLMASALLIVKGPTTLAADWKTVNKLIEEDKVSAAQRAVEKILADSRNKSDSDWARSLVKLTALRIEAGEYETAVTKLKAEPWPKSTAERALVELYYAQSLFTYLDEYSWEIGEREKTLASAKTDLKTWTTDQIYEEALAAYDNVWQIREKLNNLEIADYKHFVRENTYPKGLRPSLRDLLAYKIAEALQNTARWRPEENNDLHRLKLNDIVAGNSGIKDGFKAQDRKWHPVQRLAYVLNDLEKWNDDRDNKAGQIEARIFLHSCLQRIFSGTEDRKTIVSSLEGYLKRHHDNPWAAHGYGVLADMYREADKLITAHKITTTCIKKYKATETDYCLHIQKAIEQPAYDVMSMALDNVKERSMQVQYKNLRRIYFRAWKSDLEAVARKSSDYSLLPDYNDFKRLVSRKPDISWSVDLPETTDFQTHTVYVTPPFKDKGLYTVVTSAREGFGTKDNVLNGFNINLSRLIIRSEANSNGLTVTVLDGETGNPVQNATVSLYAYNYRAGHKKVKSGPTDSKGELSFSSLDPRSTYFLIAGNGKDKSLQEIPAVGRRNRDQKAQRNVLIYTDRGVYRPKQTIKWKVIAYSRTWNQPDLKLAPKATFDVILRDANYKTVKKIKVTTNEFGSASGEFPVPEGRMLGEWQIGTTHGDESHWISVEEYKRPTFEVSFKEIESEIRLNSKATISGEAKYYFGAPVTEGKVAYKIERTPVFPGWLAYYYWGVSPATTAQIVDAGTTRLQADGTFSISFTPDAKEPANDLELTTTYRYQVSVDLTDAGGETRSQSTSLTAGHVTVQADLSGIPGICLSPGACGLTVDRQTLNGTAAAGKGHYQLIALKMPAKTLPPAELPVSALAVQPQNDEEKVVTEGDKLRPRWEHRYSVDEYLSQWETGQTIAEGDINHGKDGSGSVKESKLAPGAYKFLYSTRDSAGKEYRSWKYFIVAGDGPGLKIPAALATDHSSLSAGKKLKIFAHNGYDKHQAAVRIYHQNKLVRSIPLKQGSQILTMPIDESMRGGISIALDILQDYQIIRLNQSVYVPWSNKELNVSFERLRDVMRPGTKETLTLKIKGANATNRAAEILAFMYDKSLDLIKPNFVQSPTSLFPSTSGTPSSGYSLNASYGSNFAAEGFKYPPGFTSHYSDLLLGVDEESTASGVNLSRLGYGAGKVLSKRKSALGGMEEDGMAMDMESASESSDSGPETSMMMAAPSEAAAAKPLPAPAKPAAQAHGESSSPRENFAETAFFLPHLVTDKKGEVTATFQLPDSLTAWNVWAVGIMKDFSSGLVQQEARTAKDLMVRLYTPRFFREGDKVAVNIVVNSTSKDKLSGNLQIAVIDEETGADISKTWGLELDRETFSLNPEGSMSATAMVSVPAGIRAVKIKAAARSGKITDAEMRSAPVLPGRMHLVQSRFAALSGREKEVLRFADLKDNGDKSRINEKMAVTIDGQLFFATLKALPYLIEYPYECTEQTLNRFLSAGIMSSLFAQSPDLAKAAAKFSSRKTMYEPWTANDPNSRMLAEESPWLNEAQGGRTPDDTALINILKKETADSVRSQAMRKLQNSQTSSGGFPWFSGGPPSPYITLYLVSGFAKAQEFGVEIPKPMVAKAWKYLAAHYKDLWTESKGVSEPLHIEFLTFLNYVASSFKDKAVFSAYFSESDSKRILDYSFKHWKTLSPYLRLMLSLTLHRADRAKDANLVVDSVLDRAKTSKETGTSWAAEDRSWLWYNDTIEMHAFALRTMTEMNLKSPVNAGIVHWLFMNKKLNQWKSTKATAEVIYSLATWLKRTGTLGAQDQVQVSIGPVSKTFTFSNDEYVGRQFMTVQGSDVTAQMADVTLQKKTGGLIFASATWHYSTEKLPEESRGDFFSIDRKFFLRKAVKGEITLTPLGKGDRVDVGDEVEVQISIRNKHQAEFVHLRDPRPAGFEPVSLTSGYKWDLGISWYEEIRDNGTNFFFEWLPTGEYTLKYRLRAANAGTFKAMPAEIQSMYAPEFNAFSSGRTIEVGKG